MFRDIWGFVMNAANAAHAANAANAAAAAAGPATASAVQPARKRRKKRHQKQTRPLVPATFRASVAVARSNAVAAHEESARSRLLDSFLRPTHGNLALYGAVHRDALENDPLLYAHLARWYNENGSIRDHHELFAAHMLSSPFEEHRACGTVLLQYLRPYQVGRVVRYAKEELRYPTRALRSAVSFYLRRREANTRWLDEHVIRNREAFRYLYSTLHIKPSEHAEAVVFARRPPADSRVAVARSLASHAHDPDTQARLILEHRIHFTTAIGAIRTFTPAMLFALATVMTPPQIINNMQFFERRGALNDPDMRLVIEQKLAAAVGHKRVSDFKSMIALSKVQADGELAKQLLNVTHERLRNRGRITRPTAILVDKSGSMQLAIDTGKLLAILCSSITDASLHVVAFDSVGIPLHAATRDVAGWEKIFKPIRADGATSIGAAMTPLMEEWLEQIVIITDGEENTNPHFTDMLDQYERRHGTSPEVFVIKVGQTSHTTLEQALRGRPHTLIPFAGDYYNLPNLVPLLCSGAYAHLLGEMLALPLYTRDDLATLPPGFDEATFEIL
jgi:hypothetical protein